MILSQLSTLSVHSSSRCKNLCRGFPLVSSIPGFPYRTNELALLFSSHGNYLSLSLSGLIVVVLGLVALSLLWSGSSPSIDAKEIPRLNEVLSLPPSGGLATPTREPTHRETQWVTGKPLLQCTSAKGVPTILTSALAFSRFPPKAARPQMAWRTQVCPSHMGGSPNGRGYHSTGAPRGPLESRVTNDPLPKHSSSNR